MKDFLLVLFYQAIVAVNTAVILNAIIWLAKRKEKQEKAPKLQDNRDFQPFTADLDRIKSELKKISETRKQKEKQTEQRKPPKPPTPPTSGTNVIEPKPKDVNIVCETKDGNNYGETIMLYGRKYRRASIWVSADKKVASMEYVEAKEPKDGVSTDEAAELFSKLSQAAAGLGGNSKLDELKERLKDFADTLDRTDKKPVTPDRLKEAGFKTEPAAVFIPAEESVKRYEAAHKIKGGRRNPTDAMIPEAQKNERRAARDMRIPHYCGNCDFCLTIERNGEVDRICVLKKEFIQNEQQWDDGCAGWKPGELYSKLYDQWMDCFCGKCKYFNPEKPGQTHGRGFCILRGESKLMGESCHWSETKEDAPWFLTTKHKMNPRANKLLKPASPGTKRTD